MQDDILPTSPASSQFVTQNAPPSSPTDAPASNNNSVAAHLDLTQDGTTPTYSQLLSHMSSTMLLHMMEQVHRHTNKYNCVMMHMMDVTYCCCFFFNRDLSHHRLLSLQCLCRTVISSIATFQ